ncbi:MAG: transcriptional repressor LexA, partial [Candidatus Eisenbacteria bacterium]
SRQPLTPRQRETLEWVKGFIRKNGMPPTVREIGGAFGIKSSTVFELLKALERKDYLKRGKLGARSLIVQDEAARGQRASRAVPVLPDVSALEEGGRVIAVPIVGTVAAGAPILAEENIIGELAVDSSLVRGASFFALEVDGDSMTGVGIGDGDTVLVRQQPLAENGDVVVAVIDGEATVKQLHIREDRVELRPKNRAHRAILVGPEDELRIAGKVVGVKRSRGSRG